MAAKSGRKPRSGERKSYYKPSPVLVKLRHRIADGVPTHELLYYLHGRNKLPKDVHSIAKTVDKLHHVRELLEAVQKGNGVGDVSDVSSTGGHKFPEIMALVDGRIVELIKSFTVEARKVLTTKTTEEPKES